jgi:hypothetical protein
MNKLMNPLIDQLEEGTNTLNARTENGAVTNRSTLSSLVDYFSLAGAMRENQEDALDLFQRAFNYCPQSALKILFYLRDVRGGQGERRLFRNAMDWICITQAGRIRHLLGLIPEYGRWDDLINLASYPSIHESVTSIISRQLGKDDANLDLELGPEISLLAKWMPSISASDKNQKQLAKEWADILGLTQKQYRKMLKRIRKQLNVVEQKMCDHQWDDINFSMVPSQAMLKYRTAFFKNAKGNMEQYLADLASGDAKVNADTLQPHQITAQLRKANLESDLDTPASFSTMSTEELLLLDYAWKNLPAYGDPQNILTICDVSLSMTTKVASGVTAMDVAIANSIYLAERCTNPLWRDAFITFSDKPQLVRLNHDATIQKRVKDTEDANWSGSTDLIKTFDLIINKTMKNAISTTQIQEILPDTIMILSDMEFNAACGGYRAWRDTVRNEDGTSDPMATTFQTIDEMFNNHGLKRPNIVFWNINARPGNCPVTVNDHGVACVSGFSPSIMQMCFSGDISPESCLRKIVLDNPRYDPIVYPG